MTTGQIARLHKLENDIQGFMERSTDGINKQFGPLRKSISPLVVKLQIHLDAFPEKENKDCKIADHGFINFNLYLNAQTAEKYTQSNASYTIISVPTQLLKITIFEEKTKDDLS